MTLWRNPDFMKLWTGQTVSELGSRITRDGLPLAAVIVLNVGPFEMGLLRAIGGAAVLLLGLYAGVWVDRLRRRPMMILSDLGRALLLAAIPIAALLHRLNMPLLYVVAALTGVLTVFFDVAYQTYLPSLIERENVLEGNSKLATSFSIAEIAGPGLTGVLVQALTAPFAILIDAVSFLFSALTIGWIRKPEVRPEHVRSEDPLHEAMAGMKFIWSHSILRALAGYAACAFFFFGIFGSVYVVYAIRDLKMGPVLLQLAIMCGGVAALFGSAIARHVSARIGLGRTFIVTAIILAVGTFLIPLAHGSVKVATAYMMLSQFLGDASMVIYNVHEISLRQTVAPENVLGRVNASMRLLTHGVLPLGSLAGALIAVPLGIRPTLWIAACGLFLSTVWLIPVKQVSRPVRAMLSERCLNL